MQVLAGTIAILLMILLTWMVLQIVACWMIYSKAGESGWKSLIPVYSTYILYKISWSTTWFWLVMVIGIVSSALLGQTDNNLMLTLGRGLSVAITIIGCINYHKLSKAFGHGIGFTLGLIFLNPIFMLILGFDSSSYIGSQE